MLRDQLEKLENFVLSVKINSVGVRLAQQTRGLGQIDNPAAIGAHVDRPVRQSVFADQFLAVDRGESDASVHDPVGHEPGHEVVVLCINCLEQPLISGERWFGIAGLVLLVQAGQLIERERILGARRHFRELSRLLPVGWCAQTILEHEGKP